MKRSWHFAANSVLVLRSPPEAGVSKDGGEHAAGDKLCRSGAARQRSAAEPPPSIWRPINAMAF